MSNNMRYDGKVAIVTGAGNGLGKAYALALAARGCKVVVNDLGGSMRGEGKDTRAADTVVDEIKKNGGQAVANYDSVVDGAKIVKTAIDAFGRVDILINNAGILRDVTFHKMTAKDWDLLYDVHLKGVYNITRAAWDHMREQKYGRIVMVSSAAGLYGNFGQAHYSTFKMAVVGFASTLAKEGAKLNIKANTIAPTAGSRMTETVLPPDLIEALKPEYVSPLVLYLTHDQCTENGSTFEVGAGWISRVRLQRSEGAFFPLDPSFTPEKVKDAIAKINDFSNPSYPQTPQDSFAPIMANLNAQKEKAAASKGAAGGAKAGAKGNSKVDVAKVMSYQMKPVSFSYTDRDVMLYALAVGAAKDQLDQQELKFTYENHPNFQTLPTFGVIIPGAAMGGVMELPGLEFNPMMLLHGEQYTEIKSTIPTSGTLVNYPKIAGVYDKGSGALVLLDVTTKTESGQEVLFNQFSIFIRGIGGFGGDKGPKPENSDPPQRPPDVIQREKTTDNQALLYRLTGDRNPLHADPDMASVGGFNKPILHGLCSFGFAGRAVLKNFANNDASKFKSIRARFAKHVFPGETLITEMWKVSDTRVLFRCKVAERGEYVLSGGVVTLVGDKGAAPAAAPKAAAAPAKAAEAPKKAGGAFAADAVFAELAKRVNASVVNQVKASYRFDVTGADNSTRSWVVDLKSGEGSVKESGDKADCIISIKDADFVQLMTGKLNAQQAFMKGQLKIKGNMMLAQKLSVLTAKQGKL